MPLHRRIPKLKGFKNPFRVEYAGSTSTPSRRSTPATRSTPAMLRAHGLVHKRGLVKVLGRGELSRRRSRCGPTPSRRPPMRPSRPPVGAVEILPAPWGDGRPPAKGNALTNR